MNRPRWWLVAPALLASAVLSVASAAEVRDKAHLFSPEAAKKAQTELDRLEKEYAVPVTIETIETLDGDTIAQVTNRHAEAVSAQGVYILIPKAEHKILAESSKHYREYLTRSRMSSVEKAFETKFKEKDFDGGLTQAVAQLETVFTDAKSDSGGTIRQNTAPSSRKGGVAVPARPAPVRKNSSGGFSLISLIIGALVLFFLFRIVMAVFRAMAGGNQYGNQGMMGGRGGYPGPGGPGYGGGGYGGAPAGGGGFMSSLFGGIGGAMAGNYLYDQFSGRGHSGVESTGMGADPAAAPIEETSPEWSGNDAGTDWGGGASTDAPAGGDWGGGGGGDWGGGGGGGGDWGGGGGSDDGGSW